MSTLEAVREDAKTIASNPYLEGNYAPVCEETTAFDLKVKGSIPGELQGRFVRVGPNPAGPIDPATYHWFTGTGMAHGLRLRDGKAEWYRSRFVTDDRAAEALGRAQLGGPRNGFGGGTANTNILNFGGKTHAVVEAGGLPVELTYELDPVARSNLGGGLAHGFTAHPKLDPLTGEQHAIAYEPMLQALSYIVVGVDGVARTVAQIPTPDCPMIHDVAITASSVVILDLPVTFDLPAAMQGLGMPFRWRRERAPRVGLLPRGGDISKLQWIELPACYVFHVMNAYDAGFTVVIDVVKHGKVFDADHRGPSEGAPRLVRWVLDRATSGFSETVLEEGGCEFPRLNDAFAAQPYRYGYTAANQGLFFGPVQKHDVTTGRVERHDFGPGRVGLEPVFIARENPLSEDDGWVIAYVYDANRNTSDVVILDARGFSDTPVATIELPVRVPFGFHGNWLADAA